MRTHVLLAAEQTAESRDTEERGDPAAAATDRTQFASRCATRRS